MDRAAWWAIVHGVTKSQTWLSTHQQMYQTIVIHLELVQVSSVQSLSHVWLFATPWTTACWASLPITNSRSAPKAMSIELVTPSKHLILCRPLLLLPSFFPSIRVFSNESACTVVYVNCISIKLANFKIKVVAHLYIKTKSESASCWLPIYFDPRHHVY